MPDSEQEHSTSEVPEIEEQSAIWRSEHSDLPLILLLLSYVKSVFTNPKGKTSPNKGWQELKRRGEQLARNRTLFIAAEAAAHLATNEKGEEGKKITKELGIVVEEGNSLHKVRALRAMAFLASDDCISFLATGLKDRSSWVQATSLHTLFRLNLRQGRPRKVLTIFLFITFYRSITIKSVLSFDDFRRNFFLNRGLFVSLLKESGGLPLAILCLVLWILTIAIKVTIAPAFVIIGSIAMAFIVAFGALAVPLLCRRLVGFERKEFNLWAGVAALLDYGLVISYVESARHIGEGFLAGAITVFWFAIICSIGFDKYEYRFAEGLRTINRGIFTLVLGLALLKQRTDLRLACLLFGLALMQVGLAYPSISKTLISKKHSILRFFISLLEYSRRLARTSLQKFAKILNGLGAWFQLRRRKVAILVFVALLLFSGSYFAKKFVHANTFTPTLLVVKTSASYIFGSAKPYLYLLVGVILLFAYCAIPFGIIHLVWDELSILERVRFETLTSRPSHFKSIDDFLAYVFRVVRNYSYPAAVRARAVFSLAQVPLANTTNVNQLLDLAEEDLPARVRDAIYQVIDAAEKRIQRGQMSTLEIDMGVINRQIDPLWAPGRILRKQILGAAISVLMVGLGSTAVVIYGFRNWQLTDEVATAELALSAALILYYVMRLGRTSPYRKWAIIVSFGLVAMASTHGIQSYLTRTAPIGLFFNFGIDFIDSGTFNALVLPTILFGIGGQVAHTLYLLDTDTLIGVPVKHGINQIEKKLERLKYKPVILKWVLIIAVIATAIESGPMQELINLHSEKMPFFVVKSDSEVDLESFPMDGRLVRVALVNGNSQSKVPLADETFPTVTDETNDGKFSRRNINEIYAIDKTCAGEVWLSSKNGTIEAWNSLPDSCLIPPTLAGGRAIFDLNAACTFRVPIRLVAIVYDKQRSELVEQMTDPKSVQQRVSRASRGDMKLLGDSLSPFVRAIWTPTLTPMPDNLINR